MKMTVDGLEKERDFYFAKLRDIELICQENENGSNPVLSKIIDILYATEVNTGVKCSTDKEFEWVDWALKDLEIFYRKPNNVFTGY